MAESPDIQAKRRRMSSVDVSKYPVIAGYRISTYAAPGTVLTMNEQKVIYHAWKKAGSPHNPLCYTCRKPGIMLHCNTCCRSYHQSCGVPKVLELQTDFHCDACTKRGWHLQPPSFEDEKSSHFYPRLAHELVERPIAEPKAPKANFETHRSISLKKDIIKSDDTVSSSPQLASGRLSEEDTNTSGKGDIIHCLQSLRERVNTLEKENEALRLNAQTKNPKKREYSS